MESNSDQGEPCCLYFPRLTVDEEFQFCDMPPGLVDWIISAAKDIPAVDRLVGAYEDCLKIDLLESFRHYQQVSGPIGNRTTQLALYVILANFIEHVAGETISCVSFYSSGAQAAYMFAGVFSPRAYLETALPVNNANRIEIVASGQRFDLSEMLVRTGNLEKSVDDILVGAIRTLNVEDRVFLKDRRGLRCCLVAGYHHEIQMLYDFLVKENSLRLTQPHRADGAHIPVYDRLSLERLAGAISFLTPRLPIVGASGELVTPSTANADALRAVYLDGVIGSLNTGAAMETASRLSQRLIVAGTPFGAKVLNPDITQHFGKMIYPSDVLSIMATFA